MGKKPNTVTGALSITSKGFGFVRVEDGPDVFIDVEHLDTAMDGDVVQARLIGTSRDRPAGRVTRIEERSGRVIVGIFHAVDGGGEVHPEDDRIPVSLFIPKTHMRESPDATSLSTGKVVTARLERWAKREEPPVGRILSVVGDQDEPGMDMKIVALSKGLSIEFPDEVRREAEALAEPDMEKETERRTDCRSLTCFTIDPRTARDFDDAISVSQRKDGLFEVGVHIADVSAFVREGSAIDEEAYRRGTSVYFVGTAINMLPERIAGDLASLMPKQDRLALSVFMVLDSRGTIHERRVEQTIIRSSQRFTYEEVESITKGTQHRYAKELQLLQLLSHVLRSRREAQGSVDFDVAGKVVVLDKEGIPRAIRPAERLESHRLVEEFMLLANRVIAEMATEAEHDKQSQPFVFRVHPTPDPDDVRALLAVVQELGIPYRASEPVQPDDYRNILSIIQNLEFRDFVERIAFGSMTKAIYTTENRGHFGLAFEAYTHFTSPIRRYADLTVHRLLKQRLFSSGKRRSGRGKAKAGPAQSGLEAICQRCSETERIATAAEREYTKLKSLEFLARRVGNIYEGIISGVASFGVFVELTRYMIEGLVHISTLEKEYYVHDEQNFRLVGQKTGKTYRLGDRVEVRIQRVSMLDRKADFVLV
jgi:ribonuclease R